MSLTAAQQRAVERIVTAHTGAPVRVADVSTAGEEPRNTFRVATDGHSWIVKASHLQPDDPALVQPWGFLQDWAGSWFAAQTAPHVAPAFLGGDRRHLVLVTEDLGRGPDLSEVLRGRDRGRAEEALQGMAHALADLHSASESSHNVYEGMWKEVAGEVPVPQATSFGLDAEDHLRSAATLASAAPPSASARRQLRELSEWVSSGGVRRSLVHGDPCLDNWLIDSRGDVRLIDYQGAVWGPPALDVSYARVPFPTCWCVRRLPFDTVASFEATYGERTTTKGSRMGANDMTFATLHWAVVHIGRALTRPMTGQASATYRGLTLLTTREDLVLRLDSAVSLARSTGVMAELTACLSAIQVGLMERWGLNPTRDIPLFPAFCD